MIQLFLIISILINQIENFEYFKYSLSRHKNIPSTVMKSQLDPILFNDPPTLLGNDNSSQVIESTPTRRGFNFIQISPVRNELRDKAFDEFIEKLDIYKTIYGDLYVPYNIQIPETSSWPEKYWNHKLGIQVQGVRQHQRFNTAHYHYILTKKGLIWNTKCANEGTLIIEGLKTYKQI